MSKVTVEQAKAMTTQEFFNLVWQRAKTKKRASDGLYCLYRLEDPSGEKLECFAGCALPDELWNRNLECKKSDYLRDQLDIWKNIDRYLMRRLQQVHDCIEPEHWEGALRAYAMEYALDIPRT